MLEINQAKSDRWIGFILLGVCVFVAWNTIGMRGQAGNTIAGTAFVPWIMIGSLAIFSIALILRSFKEPIGDFIEMPSKATFIKMIAFTAILITYAAVFMSVGYLLSTYVVFVVGLALFGERKPLTLLILPVVMTGGVYLGFTKLLKVWLP